MVCWSVGGGAGTSVVVAGLALAAARDGERVLIVDLGGDQPTLFGVPEPSGLGVAEWLEAGPDVPAGARQHLEDELVPGISLLHRGAGALRSDRAAVLAAELRAEHRTVVVDAGLVAAGGAAEALARAADRSLLVTRACPVALRRLAHLPAAPTGVVVVRDRRRAVTWPDVADASGAPVVAELEVDPAVAAAVDAGLGRRPLPRSFLRVLGGLR
jgi:MinD-like ATPase involved in chromosome partitioning or flagellar assembly